MFNILNILSLASSIFFKSCVSSNVFDEQFEVYKYNYTRRFDYKYKPITSVNDPINEPTDNIIVKDIKCFYNIIPVEIQDCISEGEITLRQVYHWSSLLSKLVNEPHSIRYEPMSLTLFANKNVKRSDLLNQCSILFQVPTRNIKICYI